MHRNHKVSLTVKSHSKITPCAHRFRKKQRGKTRDHYHQSKQDRHKPKPEGQKRRKETEEQCRQKITHSLLRTLASSIPVNEGVHLPKEPIDQKLDHLLETQHQSNRTRATRRRHRHRRTPGGALAARERERERAKRKQAKAEKRPGRQPRITRLPPSTIQYVFCQYKLLVLSHDA